MRKPKLCVLSCNWQTPETSKRKSTSINWTKHFSTKSKFGKLWFKWPKVSRLFTKYKSSTEISSALMFFAQRTANTSWEIWMFPKWPKGEWPEPKLELLTTPVLKCGMTDLTIQSVISGRWDALFMKWLRLILPSEPITWNNCIKKFKRVFTLISHHSTLKIWNTLSANVSR